MPIDDDDLRQFRRAFELAETAIGRCDPNPRVGCVLHDAHGGLAGEGATQRAGSAHAEVAALRAARAAGIEVAGGTAWVTLEPCSHQGKTPPCCDALIEARLARVVVASIDPNPLVAGSGIQRLRDVGIVVDIASGEVARQTRELNIGFFSRMLRQRPWVRMKIAASLDGRTALEDGTSQWITGEPARADGHAWRRRAGAVLTGAGTVLEDNPRLDVRLVPCEQQPLRVVIDSRLQASPLSAIYRATGQALVYCANATNALAGPLRERGVEVVPQPGANDKVDLTAVLADLAAREVNELHVEAGERLNGSFLREGLVDELLVYLAPKMIGPGRGMFRGPQLAHIQDAELLTFLDVVRVGTDLRIVARIASRDAFLA